jgi:hypothetical protein
MSKGRERDGINKGHKLGQYREGNKGVKKSAHHKGDMSGGEERKGQRERKEKCRLVASEATACLVNFVH